MTFKSALLLFLGTAMSGWASTSFNIGPTPTSVNVGDMFNLGVVLVDFTLPTSNEDQVAAFSFDVVYPAFLQVVGDPTETGLFAAAGCCFGWNSIDNVDGVISGISDFSFIPDTGIDQVVDIEFDAVAEGSGQVTLQNVSLSDEDGNAIDYGGATGGDVTATTPTAPTTPEPATWLLTALSAGIFAGRMVRRGGLGHTRGMLRASPAGPARCMPE